MAPDATAAREAVFPLWQADVAEYAAACAHLGLSPDPALHARVSAHLARAPFRAPRPAGFALHLARLRRTRFRIARLDQATRLFFPAHPARHLLNAVIAVHECDGRAFRELSRSPSGAAVWPALAAEAARFGLGLLLTLPWLAWHGARYALGAPWRRGADLGGRRVLVSGAGRGLGRDLVMHCLERGAAVVATVRTAASHDELVESLPLEAPLTVVVSDLERPGALAAALDAAGLDPRSIDVAIACAGVKRTGASALSLDDLRRTFEVNLFAAAELGAWFCGRAAQSPGEAKPAALVLVSSMGRWHGMHESGGYNASKAALSIWGESVEMDLRRSGRRATVTIVEPGLFASGMTRPIGPARWLLASRRDVARAIVDGALAGRRSIRPPAWFALLTWSVLLGGRRLRARLFGSVKPGKDAP